METPSDKVPIAGLVEHADHIAVITPLAAAQAEFARRGRRFLGVTDRGRFVGTANGREIAALLSTQYGHALHGRSAIGGHVMKEALVVTPETPFTELLKLTAGRSDQAFYHDIAVVTATGEFVGLIPMHRIARLQTALLLANLERVEEQRRELANRNRRMEEDLRMARHVQLAMLPAKPLRIEWAGTTASAGHFYEPAETIGGDFFAVFSPAAGVLACGVCDVMGHGVRPALITAILRALIEESEAVATNPGALLTQLNRRLLRLLHTTGDVIFVTAGFAVIDLPRGELRYAQAGHPNPQLWRQQTGGAAELALAGDSAGPALGLIDEFEFATTAVPFSPGDVLLIVTDGVLEALSPSGEEFGPERLQAALALAVVAGLDIGSAVAEAARRFTGSKRFADDVCVLAVRIG